MNPFRTIWGLIRSCLHRQETKHEIDDELRFHLEMREQENLRAGMSPEEARREAMKRFGNVQAFREQCRDVRGVSFGETTWRDIRFGLRMLRKNPGFTFVAVLTLAIGIGANTAIFSLLNAIVIKQLGYRDPDRLVVISYQYTKLFKESQINAISPRGYFDCRSNVKSFEGLAASRWWTGNLTDDSVPEALEGMRVTANFFQLLGVTPVIGRTFTEDEAQPGTDRVVMLSYRFWQRRFGGDPKILGRMLMFDEHAYQVIGVLPPTLKFQKSLEVWTPLTFTPEEKQSSSESLFAVARLKPGMTLQQARAELDALAKPVREQNEFLMKNGWYVLAKPFKEVVVRDIRPVLLVSMGAVALVLLIACVNIANLQLARGIGRQKEIAIRMALGASRSSLIRQLLTENLLLAALGGGCGLLLGYGSLRSMIALLPSYVVDYTIGMEGVPLDSRMLIFAIAASILCGLVFGIAPALQAFRFPVNPVLKEGGPGANTVGHRRLRALMAGTQVALALILLTGAGLLLKSFVQITRVDAGFNPEKLLSLRFSLPSAKYLRAEKSEGFFNDLLDRTRRLSGVKSAALVSSLPLSGMVSTLSFKVEGYADEGHGAPSCSTPEYFHTMQIRLLQGRDFVPSDTTNSLPVIIVDEKLAQQYWPNQNPIGKRIAIGFEEVADKPVWREVVGVVNQVKIYGLDTEAKQQLYIPLTQHWFGDAANSDLLTQNLVIRTEEDPNGLVETVRRTVLTIDSYQPITDVKTMHARLDESLTKRRTPMLLVAVFAAVALVLAIIGLYGVMAYTTSQRTREFAIRLALGAERRAVIQLVLRQAFNVIGIGIIAGLLGAWALSRLLNSLLVGVETTDPVTFIGVPLLLAVIAILACYFPARRAAKIEPMAALRGE